MRSDNDPIGIAPAERELEAALRSLTPAPGRVDAVTAAFAAGRNVQRRQLRAWRAAAAVALGIGTLGWLNPMPREGDVARDPAQPVPTLLVSGASSPPPLRTPPASPAPSAQSVLVMRRAVDEGGLQALSAPQLPAPRNIRNEELF